MDTITYSEARQNMAKIMNEVCQNNEIKIITRERREAVVMMSLDDYNAIMETAYLTANPHNAAFLRNSLQQADEGKLVKVKISRG